MIKGLSNNAKAFASRVEGQGLFAAKPIAKGESILDLSSHDQEFITRSQADERYAQGFDFMIQVSDDRFAVTVTRPEELPRGYLNHSCEPNCGIQDSVRIVAMRDIASGEELTFDYVMSESSEYTMQCACQSLHCRKLVTGDDWKSSMLQKKYKGFFSEYLQQKIESLDASRRSSPNA